MDWLKARLKEKSTKTAIAGLFPVIFSHLGMSNDVNNAVTAVIVALLLGSAATEG